MEIVLQIPNDVYRLNTFIKIILYTNISYQNINFCAACWSFLVRSTSLKTTKEITFNFLKNERNVQKTKASDNT
jgi:hypothetical protein